ncbi:MAG: tRNA (adenosine(37)-N6)-dimethylallyltransferase MiaA [Pseudomonadota bacterium]
MPVAKPPHAILLMGPTASGKSRLALEIATRLPCEIVSVDSAQVYRGMDIGTAKPDAATLRRVPHHLIDILDPGESYSAAQFRADALRVMAEITARGNIPLLAGGTMLYFKALIEGLSELPPADPGIRMVIEEMARAADWPTLHTELARLDPVTAARLEPTDAQRIQRALEVCYITGKPMSEALKRREAAVLPYALTQIALVPSDRNVLHQRIAERFEIMLELGLINEVRNLRARYALDLSMPSMRCVGYRQAWHYLDGDYGLAALREKGIAATRQLAKRQLTWLRGMAGLTTFDCLDENLSAAVMAYTSHHLLETNR